MSASKELELPLELELLFTAWDNVKKNYLEKFSQADAAHVFELEVVIRDMDDAINELADTCENIEEDLLLNSELDEPEKVEDLVEMPGGEVVVMD